MIQTTSQARLVVLTARRTAAEIANIACHMCSSKKKMSINALPALALVSRKKKHSQNK
jgi:hypothetical protein